MKKTVLITGASSGFGKVAAKLFHTKGWNVIATMRSPEKETELSTLSNVFITKLDVIDKQSMRAMAHWVRWKPPRKKKSESSLMLISSG